MFRAQNGFGPTTSQLLPQLEGIRLAHGAASIEYARALSEYAEAEAREGGQSNSSAEAHLQECYLIFENLTGGSAETASAADRLSALKHANGDYEGAVRCLGHALSIWEKLAERGDCPVDDFYRTRRQEDRQRLQIMLKGKGTMNSVDISKLSSEEKKALLEKLIAEKSEIEKAAQAFAVAGMTIPDQVEQDYTDLKQRIEQLQSAL